MKKTMCILFAAAVLLLSACNDSTQQPQDQFLNLQKPQATEGDSPVQDTQVQAPEQPDLRFQSSVETGNCYLKSGSLEFTLSNPRIATCEAQLPTGGDFFEAVATVWKNGEPTDYKLYSKRIPSFIQEDGNFVEGIRLVLIDLTVTNIDAVALTRQDADANGRGGGNYDDPSVFRIDTLLNMADTGEKAQNTASVHGGVVSTDDGQYTQYSMGYFSHLSKRSEHPFAYYLAPGETFSCTVGFLLGNNSNGTDKALSGMAARICNAQYLEGEQVPSDTIYYVNLGFEDDER